MICTNSEFAIGRNGEQGSMSLFAPPLTFLAPPWDKPPRHHYSFPVNNGEYSPLFPWAQMYQTQRFWHLRKHNRHYSAFTSLDLQMQYRGFCARAPRCPGTRSALPIYSQKLLTKAPFKYTHHSSSSIRWHYPF
jgi:hypothetical protein